MDQFGIIGDSYATDLPETSVDLEQLEDERNKAKFSRTQEFKKLKEYIDSRVKFYQTWLPDGRDIRSVDPAILGQQWVVANAVTAELKAIIAIYEQAKDAIDERRRTNS